ncbi:hypothetical protein [Amycolatopsis sp. NPDC051903]|uniref:hypothetical protein n=1 Tax=Amycolatopsis sp. NPDC051903 TaxID=3363936 RepID=UPI00379EA2E3
MTERALWILLGLIDAGEPEEEQPEPLQTVAGSGYIGSWCVLALLAEGHSVRTTVRNLKKKPELRAMLGESAAPDDAKVVVVQAGLRQDAGWGEAVRLRGARSLADAHQGA